jgi:hypothetical protein
MKTIASASERLNIALFLEQFSCSPVERSTLTEVSGRLAEQNVQDMIYLERERLQQLGHIGNPKSSFGPMRRCSG